MAIYVKYFTHLNKFICYVLDRTTLLFYYLLDKFCQLKKGQKVIMPDLDDKNDTKVAATDGNSDGATPVAKVVKPKPTEEPKKLELTQEELDDIKREAVASAQAEQEERIRREEAERQGNYKALFEQAEAEKKEANLQLWRQKALNKYKLSEDLEDSLIGDTEEDLMKIAKKLRSNIDREVEAKLKAETTSPPDPGRINPPRQKPVNEDEVTRRTLKNALAIGRVLH
jgi:hypothetical protein